MEDFKEYLPPSWDEYFMTMVYLVAKKSKDPSSKLGAVLVKDNRVIGSGYNGFPIGVNDLLERYNNRELKYKFVVHAEHNAILSCARFGISSMGSVLYTQGIPCQECTKAIVQGGIEKVIIHKQWPDMKHSKWQESVEISKQMLKETEIQLEILDFKLNVNGYLNGKVFLV